jgi:hypothetical protein
MIFRVWCAGESYFRNTAELSLGRWAENETNAGCSATLGCVGSEDREMAATDLDQYCKSTPHQGKVSSKIK